MTSIVNHSRSQLSEIESSLDVEFNDITLLEQALVHSSFVAEFPGVFRESNERLEFLGDAVLDLIVAAELVSRFPDRPEGFLTQVRASLVDKPSLATIGAELGLGDWLVLGKGEIDRGGRDRASNLADAFEAVLGALYLDQGYDVTHAFAVRVMGDTLGLAGESGTAPRHPKSLLHEAAMQLGFGPPEYVTTGMDGPSHEPTFTVQALVDGVTVGSGQGRNKKSAGSEAALEALKALQR